LRISKAVFGYGFMDNKEKYVLLTAKEKDAKYSNPMLRLFLALGYLGIFSGLITVYMAVMTALSREDHKFEYTYAAAAAVIFAVCIALVLWLNYKDKKARKAFFKHEKELRKNAKKYRGKIVGIEKYVRHVRYLNDIFDEITWRFIIKYKNENDEIVTVKSDDYLNDITDVLVDSKVSVYCLEDDTFEFKGFKLRESDSDVPVKFKVHVFEEDVKV